MKKAAFVILIGGTLILTLGGCAAQQDIYVPDVLPRLRDYQPITCTSPVLTTSEYRVTVQMNIDEEGNVTHAALRKTTGSPEMDDSILTAVQQWKYYPAEVKGQPVPLAMAQQITIRFEPSLLYTLAEIVVPSSALADSIVQEIHNGIEFEELARRFSNSQSAVIGGYLGRVELKNFRPDIYKEVRKLYPGDISAPLTVDHSYIIYKRIK